MRHLLFAICALSCAAAALAQDAEPRPFVVGELEALMVGSDATGRQADVGFSGTVGTRAWRGIQLFGRASRAFEFTRTNQEHPPGALQMTTWSGIGGTRWLLPSSRRFVPYAEAGAGMARISSGLGRSADHGAVVQAGQSVPLATVSLGSQVYLGRRFTVDGGYRVQRLFGAADTTRKRPYVGFGVRF